ncbi:MAG: hypothetical protein L6277_04755 [Desulfobacterales bacterium]|nr:hypothetical protein [Pseudomonadota bacterium]MBU4357178.1 hypothetical protein [Pseudomonadota bacterium]MCG2771383.1 hypothetical protein [Desulfobacterales bacterium]
MNDDHKKEGTQAGNDVTSEEEEVKELPPPNKHRSKGWKKIDFKPREQAEAERLFFLFFPEASHWETPSILLPFNPTNYFPEFKQEALAILSTGIIGEDGLKGHKETFPVNQRDLIIALLETDFKYRDVTFFPGDILKRFDRDFNSMAAIASLAGVTDKKIKNVRDDLQKWRDKISQAVSQGIFPSNWRELMKEELISSYEYHPKSQAQAFAIIFLGYAPTASDKIIATWVNAVLKSLQCHTASESKLREYISKERELRSSLPRKPSKNPQ